MKRGKAEAEKILQEVEASLKDKVAKLESEAESEISNLRGKASANMDKAVERVIAEVLGGKP